MADNLTISTAGGNETVAADEISSVKYQRAKLIHGIDGTNDNDVARTNPLPVQTYPESGTIMAGSAQATIKFASISLTATGNVVAAPSDATKRIRVISLFMTLDVVVGDETYQFKDDAAGTAVTGLLGEASGAGTVVSVSMGFNPGGWFQALAGKPLELAILGAAPSAQGCLSYIEV